MSLVRVRIGQLQEELRPAVAGLADHLATLVERVTGTPIESLGAELRTMHAAAVRLRELVENVVEASDHAGAAGDSVAERIRRIRHDLRTPLNLVKGYGEMVQEDLAELDDPLVPGLSRELVKLLAASDDVLEKIDAIGDVALFVDVAVERGESESEGGGVIVDISSTHPLAREPAVRTVEPGRVLVVDDLESNRVFLEQRLRRDGHDVAVAGSGAEALSRLAEESFDVILLDLIMPGGMNGFQVLHLLKANEHLRDIPVIVISAVSEIDSAVRCIESGAEDYLPKPFNPVLLRARLSACLERKRWRDRERSYLERIRHAATHDPLTNLPNRHHFMEELTLHVERTLRDGSRRALLFIDLDGFKAVNDGLGHESGDLVLKEVAERLRRCVTPDQGMVARIGGDEFAVLLTQIDGHDHAAETAERIVTTMREPMLGGRASIGSSIGIAIITDHGTIADDVMRAADGAMYAVKKTGKNCYRFVNA